jgi:hypothetical protein
MLSHREHHLPCLNQSAASFVGFRFGCCTTRKHPARSPDRTFGTRWNKLSILWFDPSSMSQVCKRELKPVTQFFESKSGSKMGTQHPNSWWFQQKVHTMHSLKHTEFPYWTIFVTALIWYIHHLSFSCWMETQVSSSETDHVPKKNQCDEYTQIQWGKICTEP